VLPAGSGGGSGTAGGTPPSSTASESGPSNASSSGTSTKKVRGKKTSAARQRILSTSSAQATAAQGQEQAPADADVEEVMLRRLLSEILMAWTRAVALYSHFDPHDDWGRCSPRRSHIPACVQIISRAYHEDGLVISLICYCCHKARSQLFSARRQEGPA
jgi:hypothetical protein